MKLGTWLGKKRTERGWSQMDLSKKLGITGRHVVSYELGNQVPPLRCLIRIAKVFDADFNEVSKMAKDRDGLKQFAYSNPKAIIMAETKELADETYAAYIRDAAMEKANDA